MTTDLFTCRPQQQPVYDRYFLLVIITDRQEICSWQNPNNLHNGFDYHKFLPAYHHSRPAGDLQETKPQQQGSTRTCLLRMAMKVRHAKMLVSIALHLIDFIKTKCQTVSQRLLRRCKNVLIAMTVSTAWHASNRR